MLSGEDVARVPIVLLVALFAVPPLAPIGHANQIWSTDSGGIDEKRVFQSNEAVYVTGEIDSFGFPPRAKVCVTEDREWSNGDAIADVTLGGCNAITSFLGREPPSGRPSG